MSNTVLPRILIVEDDQTFRETVSEILRDVGYQVKGARTLRKATKRLKKHKFDLVLTDVHLGGDSGFDVLQIAHEKRPEARIMLMSSQVDPELIEQALASGATRFISKPFRVKELLQAVEESLGNAPNDGSDPLDSIA
jgi:CheY-like chemotaxis protein